MDIWEIYHNSFQRELTVEELEFLDTMIQKYPYFAMARFLKAKAIPTVYNMGLASAHAPSRPMFKSFIEGKKVLRSKTNTAYMQNRKPTYPSTASSHKHELFSIIDSSAQVPVQIEELPFSVITESKIPSYEGFLDTRVKEKVHAHQELVQDISLQIKEYRETPHRPGRKETDSLIQAFLDKNPKIRRPEPISELQEIKKVADYSVEKDEEIVSETLAKIHLQQNNTHEALRIYRKLSLLFPEKSAYFDAQISSIHTK